MSIKSLWLFVIAFIFITANCRAQNISRDSSSYPAAANKAVDLYIGTISEQAELYNGAVYDAPPKASKGSVYFNDVNYPTQGSVYYNRTLYKNIPVVYNVYSDIMVVASHNAINYILRPEKASDVYLLNHHFVYLNGENTGGLAPGYYDQLYGGKVLVLVKRTKGVTNTVSAQGVEVFYTDNSEFYIKKGDKYYPVYSKGSVLSVFKDKKKDLNQYLSNNKIRFNKNRDASIAVLAQYYDQITN